MSGKRKIPAQMTSTPAGATTIVSQGQRSATTTVATPRAAIANPATR